MGQGSEPASILERKYMFSSSFELAVIIPAYKRTFLREALLSFGRQTDARFSLYIMDDGSPYDLGGIAGEFPRFIYHRFEENLGKSDLIKSWNRCIKSVSSEWIWFFSDDDIVGDRCVELFYRENWSGKDLFRFNTRIIDQTDAVVASNLSHPRYESSEAFLRRRLAKRTSSFVSEYIFRRESLVRGGGFVSFPYAWHSDDATWLMIGNEHGICTIPGERVLWRSSGENISSDRSIHSEKLAATCAFLDWACANVDDGPIVRALMLYYLFSSYSWKRIDVRQVPKRRADSKLRVLLSMLNIVNFIYRCVRRAFLWR